MDEMKLRVTPEKTEVVVFNEEENKRIDEICASLDVADSQQMIQFGVAAQSRISTFSDNILAQVRSKDAGFVGEMMTDLVVKVKDLEVDKLEAGGKKQGFFSKLGFGKLAASHKRFMEKFERIDVQIEKLTNELDKARMELLKDVGMFDALYEKNLEYFKELNLYIAAGERKLEELNTTVIPELREKARQSGEQIDAQRANDMEQVAIRFEKKVHDLKLSKMISIQTAPQIRLIQNNDRVMVDKIQTSILNTIPLWKNQIVIAIGLFRQQKALEMQREVTNTTNELLAKNADLLKTNTLEIARESERGIVEIETLKKVNTSLIETLEETVRIQEKGRIDRRAAEGELTKMEDELKNKLIGLSDGSLRTQIAGN